MARYGPEGQSFREPELDLSRLLSPSFWNAGCDRNNRLALGLVWNHLLSRLRNPVYSRRPSENRCWLNAWKNEARG
jgi:hypothetical protein